MSDTGFLILHVPEMQNKPNICWPRK